MLKGFGSLPLVSVWSTVDTARRLRVDSKSLSGSLRAETPVFDEDSSGPAEPDPASTGVGNNAPDASVN